MIQFDIETQQIDTIDIERVKNIFSQNNSIYVLTDSDFLTFERTKIKIKTDLIKYKYVKISLVGHTGVGRTTLCSCITTGRPGAYKSTYGRKVWSLITDEDSEQQERRVILLDHGGQEETLSTFLPFLSDSDIILILFQQNDRTTFNKAVSILESLGGNVSEHAKIFFVQTHTDELCNISEQDVKAMVAEGKIRDNFKVVAKDASSVRQLRHRLTKEISWENARIVIRSQYTDGALKTLEELQKENVGIISIAEFSKRFKQATNLTILKPHLQFILTDLGNQGMIEYHPEFSESYPDAKELIILDDPQYNKLRTEIPNYVKNKKGIVSVEELTEEFGRSKYFPMIARLYVDYRICLGYQNLMVFPELLTDREIRISENLQPYFKDEPAKIRLSKQKINIGRLMEALSELKLQCIDVSLNEGLFSWEENAVIYYTFQPVKDAVRGSYLQCSYYIGGKKEETCKRLNQEFLRIIEQFYGSLKQLFDQDKKNLK